MDLGALLCTVSHALLPDLPPRRPLPGPRQRPSGPPPHRKPGPLPPPTSRKRALSLNDRAASCSCDALPASSGTASGNSPPSTRRARPRGSRLTTRNPRTTWPTTCATHTASRSSLADQPARIASLCRHPLPGLARRPPRPVPGWQDPPRPRERPRPPGSPRRDLEHYPLASPYRRLARALLMTRPLNHRLYSPRSSRTPLRTVAALTDSHNQSSSLSARSSPSLALQLVRLCSRMSCHWLRTDSQVALRRSVRNPLSRGLFSLSVSLVEAPSRLPARAVTRDGATASHRLPEFSTVSFRFDHSQSALRGPAVSPDQRPGYPSQWR